MLIQRNTNILEVARSQEKARWLPAGLIAMAVTAAILLPMTGDKQARAAEVTADDRSNDENKPAIQVVRKWLTLIEQDDREAAADLMRRGKNENADDGLSMSVMLGAAAQGNVVPAEVYATTNRALVTTNSIEEGQHKGKSFIFHLAFDLNRQLQWKIHEVSLVGPSDKKVQLDAFRAKPVNQPVDSLGFGPVIERTLKATDSYTVALNLDANLPIPVPNDFGRNRTITQDPIKWMVVRGADLGPTPAPNGGMELRGIFLPRVSRVANDMWETANAARVRELLPARRSPPTSSTLQSEDGSYPVTYVFETMSEPTGTSQQGILQILAIDPERGSVKLRYRLVGN